MSYFLQCVTPSTTMLVGAAYALPKIGEYLCTRPDVSADPKVIDKLRETLATSQETLRAILGERIWVFSTEVVADNAWISAIVIFYLSNGIPAAPNDFDQALNLGASAIGFSCASWVFRVLSVKMFPWLGAYIAPPHMR